MIETDAGCVFCSATLIFAASRSCSRLSDLVLIGECTVTAFFLFFFPTLLLSAPLLPLATHPTGHRFDSLPFRVQLGHPVSAKGFLLIVGHPVPAQRLVVISFLQSNRAE